MKKRLILLLDIILFLHLKKYKWYTVEKLN